MHIRVLALGYTDAPSFDIDDSDYIWNTIFADHFSSNLIYYREGGRFEPMLAESWEILSGGIEWSFVVPPRDICEDGSPFDASEMRLSLLRALKRYSGSSHIPVFSELRGWDNGIETVATEGLVVEADKLTFRFKTKVEEGLLEFLSMPYYGFICDSNFDEGKWKKKTEIVSSGPFVLDKLDKQKNQVKLRKNQKISQVMDFTVESVQVDYGFIKIDELSDAEIAKYDVIIGPNLEVVEERLVSVGKIGVTGIPTVLTGVILNPSSSNGFGDDGNRINIAHRLHKEIEEKSEMYSILYKHTNRLFDFEVSNSSLVEPDEGFFAEKGKIVIRALPSLSDRNTLLEKSTRKVFEDLGYGYEINKGPIGDVKNFTSNEQDVRIFQVHTGVQALGWVVEMMFCSKLGINFPDPNNSICSLVAKRKKGEVDLEEFTRLLNDIVLSESYVIPLLRGGNIWFVSEEHKEGLSGFLSYPRFDYL